MNIINIESSATSYMHNKASPPIIDHFKKSLETENLSQHCNDGDEVGDSNGLTDDSFVSSHPVASPSLSVTSNTTCDVATPNKATTAETTYNNCDNTHQTNLAVFPLSLSSSSIAQMFSGPQRPDASSSPSQSAADGETPSIQAIVLSEDDIRYLSTQFPHLFNERGFATGINGVILNSQQPISSLLANSQNQNFVVLPTATSVASTVSHDPLNPHIPLTIPPRQPYTTVHNDQRQDLRYFKQEPANPQLQQCWNPFLPHFAPLTVQPPGTVWEIPTTGNYTPNDAPFVNNMSAMNMSHANSHSEDYCNDTVGSNKRKRSTDYDDECESRRGEGAGGDWEGEFKCPIAGCCYVTTGPFRMKTHIRYHEESKLDIKGKRIYRCLEPNCGYLSTCSSNYRVHRRTHTGVKPYQCGVAGCTFKSAQSNNLKTHILRNHPGASPTNVVRHVSATTKSSDSKLNAFDDLFNSVNSLEEDNTKYVSSTLFNRPHAPLSDSSQSSWISDTDYSRTKVLEAIAVSSLLGGEPHI